MVRCRSLIGGGLLMRFAYIADIHIDYGKQYSVKEYIDALIRALNKKKVDLLFIGGDISNTYADTTYYVEALQEQAGLPVYFVPGNHDFWQQKKELVLPKGGTWSIFEQYQQHPQSLLGKSLQLTEDTWLLAHSGWYNYAVHSPRFSNEDLEKGRYRFATWQDKKFINWGMSDLEVSALFADQTKLLLEKLPFQAKNIILATHIVTRPEFTMPMPHRVFDFFNAYIATDDFKPIMNDNRLKTAFMGHIHFRHLIDEANKQYISSSLGYTKQWLTPNLNQEMENSLYVVDLP